jgi:hypothetical protein
MMRGKIFLLRKQRFLSILMPVSLALSLSLFDDHLGLRQSIAV